MKKKCKIIALTTEKADRAFVSINQELRLEKGVHNYPLALYPLVIGYHLYLLSDDEIKEGDWFFHEEGLFCLPKQHVAGATCKKIIASTDPELGAPLESVRIDFIDFSKKEPLICSTKSKVSKRAAFPQFSEEFIEAYVKAGGIDEVMVEYLPANCSGCGSALENRELCSKGECHQDKHCSVYSKRPRQPKIKNDNTVNIYIQDQPTMLLYDIRDFLLVLSLTDKSGKCAKIMSRIEDYIHRH